MRLLIYFYLISFTPLVAQADDGCSRWFTLTGISSSDKNCELKCASSSTDMSTFMCSSRCEKYCNNVALKKCEIKASWKRKIQSGLPPQWPYNETPSTLSATELDALKQILEKLSDHFPIDQLVGIYKLERPRSLFSIGTPSTYLEGKIVLYQKAFDRPENLLRILVHELAHHLHEHDLKAEFLDYKSSLKWTTQDSRPGPFIDSDSKDSPEEDFANNFENYVLAPKKLSDRVPRAFEWMQKRLKNKFQMKECAK